MKFRPCIDIHNGKVKQIVGGSLADAGDRARDNFVSEKDAAYYADLYRADGLSGGHVILLNPPESSYYKEDLRQAQAALETFPGGLMIGGGVNDENAGAFLKMGASHVIVTSFVFRDGKLDKKRLNRMVAAVGREHLVLDLSCRRRKQAGDYYIVTDRWQKFTDVAVTPGLLKELSACCDEYLIHAVDVEGKQAGIEENLVRMLGTWNGLPITYAGGIHTADDIQTIARLGRGKLDFTVGSALDLFGGPIPYRLLRSDFKEGGCMEAGNYVG